MYEIKGQLSVVFITHVKTLPNNKLIQKKKFYIAMKNFKI